MAFGAYYTASETLAPPGHRAIVFVGVLGWWLGGREASKLASSRVQLGDPRRLGGSFSHGRRDDRALRDALERPEIFCW